MTPRELHLFMEGQEEHWRRIREVLAWTQANVMNAFGGKGKVKPDKLLPKSDVQHRKRASKSSEEQPQSLMGMDSKAVGRLFAERRLQKEEATWRHRPDALRLTAVERMLGYGPEENDPQE